ncbi:SprT family zinc-dependent metalloprotease [Shewanella sp. SG44-2]|uniref:SprT family zinc-dependent metalloprotease n=1 Tax=Shewanella sp. SG44-2 TaxID=2760962 RepID=UPI0016016FFD|nr:SprT family zinc-dependent metalloprotease [Shewanella sp. SG44-2]MBB1425934.1 SprT family zinc-dependent metalloprotease [Shewanella sp. SG44-2]
MFKNIFNLTQRAHQALTQDVHEKGSSLSTGPCPHQTQNTTVSNPLQLQILAKVEADYLLAEQHFKRQFPRPSVDFSLRGKSAGTAHLQTNKLRFNPVLLAENHDIFINEVVPHEISHLLCFHLFGKVKPHGKEWQSVMLTTFKITPKTTHQLNTQSVSGQQFEYFCGCGSINLTIRRHNRIVRGQTQYRCRHCQQTLTSFNPK